MSTPELLQARLSRLRQSRNPIPVPQGFERFWQETARELCEIAPAPRTRNYTGSSHGVVCAEFDSWQGRKISCWFSSHERSEFATDRVLIVTCHGYGGANDPERVRRLASLGFDVVGVDTRGFGLSRDALSGVSPYGHMLTGCQSREESILRGTVCDYLQAYRAAVKWFGTPRASTFQGFSFAGGLAVMASGVLAMAREVGLPLPRSPGVVAVGAPTFGDLDSRIRLCQAGSGKELSEYLQMHPDRTDETLDVFRYFDACYFAPFLGKNAAKIRVIAGVGIQDPIVPAETVYAIYNALLETPELHEFPCSHTERKEERQWVRWESAWIRASQELLS